MLKNYPDGEVKYFFLLSGGEDGLPASAEAVEKWNKKYKFGAHGITLRDHKQNGFKAFFPDASKVHGTVVLSKGFKVYMPFTKSLDKATVDEALEAK